MAVAAVAIRGASDIYAIGSRPNCAQVAKEFGATHIINYKTGDIVQQVLDLTGGKGADRVVIAGGDNDTFDQAIRMLKPAGKIGNINYLGEGDYVKIPRVEWGVGMGHKQIVGGLMLGGRLRMEQYAALWKAGRINPGKMVTHKYNGFDKVEEALFMMRDKAPDLIKPVVII
jgi:threonine dehydrogenase-like Zn-dependent dehydrogenase